MTHPRQRASVTEEPLHLAGRLALSVSEAAAAIGVSERHFRTILGEIPHLYVGKRVVIPVQPLQDWLRARAQVEGNRVDEAVKEIMASIDKSGKI